MDIRLSDCWPLTYVALLVSLYVIVSLGPAGFKRVLGFCVLVLLTLVSPCFMFGALLAIPQRKTVETLNAGLYTVKLVTSYDPRCCDIYGNNISLVLERPFAVGFFNEDKTLLFVQPARKATVELVEHGRTVKFTAPALEKRQEVVRTYSVDWFDNINRDSEIIVVEPDYIKYPILLDPGFK